MGPNFRSGSISGEQDGLGRALRRHRPSQVLDQVERSGARRDEDRLSSRGPGEQEPVAEHHEEAAPDANGLLESLAGAHRLPQQAGQRGRFLVSIPQKNRGNGRIVKKCQKVGNRKKVDAVKKNQHQKNFFFCLRHKKNFSALFRFVNGDSPTMTSPFREMAPAAHFSFSMISEDTTTPQQCCSSFQSLSRAL